MLCVCVAGIRITTVTKDREARCGDTPVPRGMAMRHNDLCLLIFMGMCVFVCVCE